MFVINYVRHVNRGKTFRDSWEICLKTLNNKIVLLRERKSHTAHRVKYSICCPDLAGGTPSLVSTVVPPAKGPGSSHWGTPGKGHGTSGSIMGWRWSTPHPERTWDQWKYYGMEMEYPPPRKDMGPVEVLWNGDGVTPPHPGCELTNKLKLLPSPSIGCGR